ncbi:MULTISPECIES: hypothetical protein [unclassified Streptomyces]|uniref:hypothetical protein n=1 Tax=unclassified Streptomyces TaxID=2593676 RepID=UPI001BE6F281|nr:MULTISPECIES: hypothetical protein [unclassified Streptomyces]MBT2406786.1 hypothetical protein [Streptomyces sp. ISL-21]MBT2456642.1 hypothetical protein [Streptomyces sp. ISL-86]MBT2612206.1 hypothetical protein [Streptomyces sp. ISL-87]
MSIRSAQATDTTLNAPVGAARWAAPLRADTWRRVGYAFLALPVSAVCLVATLLGQGRTASRIRRRLEGALLPGATPAQTRPGALAAAKRLLLGIPLELAAFIVVAYSAFNTVRNLGYPIWYGDTDYHQAWGGPTLGGVWAVHSLGWLACLYVILWLIRGLTHARQSL